MIGHGLSGCWPGEDVGDGDSTWQNTERQLCWGCCYFELGNRFTCTSLLNSIPNFIVNLITNSIKTRLSIKNDMTMHTFLSRHV